MTRENGMKDLLSESEIEAINKIEYVVARKLFFVLLLLAKQSEGFVIMSKYDILHIVCSGIVRNYDMYDTCIYILLKHQYINIIDGYIFIDVENHIDIMDEDIEDIDLYYEFYFGSSTVKECLHCKRPFVASSNNQKYCSKHRGYIKIGNVSRICCDCGKKFLTKANNKIRCDSCQRIHRNKVKNRNKS